MIKIKKKIVVGTWPLSGDYGIVKPSTVEDVLIKSYRFGLREYDTAPSYGNGFIESLLGSVFYNIKNIKINTKVGNLPFDGKSFNLDDIKRSIDNSLSRLKTQQLNVLFLHNPRDEIIKDQKKILRYLKYLKLKKVIKFTGLSCAPNYKYKKKFLNFFDYLQDDFNLLKRSEFTYKKNIYARSVFANGILAGAIDRNIKFDKNDHRSTWLNIKERRNSLRMRLKVIRKHFGDNLTQLSANYVLSQKNTYKAIFGLRKIEHLNNLKLMLHNFKNNPNLNKKIDSLIQKDFFLNQKHKNLGF